MITPTSGADTAGQSDDGATRSKQGIPKPPERGDNKNDPAPGLIDSQDATTPRPGTEPRDAPRGTDAQEASNEGETRIANGGLGALAVYSAFVPFLLVHFISVIIPMRVAHDLLVEKTDVGKSDRDFYAGAQTPSAGGKQESGTSEGVLAGDDTDEARQSPPEDGEADGASVPLVPTADRRSPGAVGPSTDEGISQAGAGGVGRDGDMIPAKRVLEGGVAGVPALIRRNLARPELAIRR